MGVLCPLLTLASSVIAQALLQSCLAGVGGAVPLLLFEIDGECKEWEPNWGASNGDV